VNDTGTTARQLIDEAVDLKAEDLASDFVEIIVGRFFFATSWTSKRELYDSKLRQWLEANGHSEKHSEVAALIDQWAAEGHSWNDRWETDYSAGDKPKSVKQKTKPKRSPKNGHPTQTGRTRAA
jgi:hypothetical protein